ncbi:ankyrin repeat-containing domain, PGG domain protein [Tanacetum coccineum]
MAKEDEEKMTFITSQGILCYTKMPFGLRNAWPTYERLVDKAFHKQIGRNLEVYVDDLVIKSHTKDEIVRDIEETFKTLREINMKLNPKKCTFGVEEGMFLGYKVNTKGLEKSDFHWTTEAEETFKQIKQLIAELPMLTAPMEKEELIVYLAAAKETGIKRFEGIYFLIWKVNDDNQTIFHVAVKYRHEDIYTLLYEIGSMKDMVIPLTDLDEKNMLHLAAKSTKIKNFEDVSGAALQMQQELLWFKEVESMIPPYRERKNKHGQTPHELFIMEHQHLVSKGEKWMKETASQCMVVAELIATIVFAAAFTVPGGYNQNDGIPMFKRKSTFVVFVVADAISLILSSASILTFLSILTSRYAECNFERSLPMMLMFALAALFLSIGTMMVTFSVSFFALYHI